MAEQQPSDNVCQFPCPALRQTQSDVRDLESRLGRVIDRWRDHLGGLILRTAAELKQSVGPVESDLRLVKLDLGDLSGRVKALESDADAGRTTLSELKIDQSDVAAELKRIRRATWKHRATGGAVGLLAGALPQIIEALVRALQ